MTIRQLQPASAPHQPYLPQQTLPSTTSLYRTLEAPTIHQCLQFLNPVTKRGGIKAERSPSEEGRLIHLRLYLSLTQCQQLLRNTTMSAENGL